MIRFENECVGCPPHMGCLGSACPYANVPYVVCDKCGEDIDPDSPRYNLDEEYHVCENCEPDEEEDDGYYEEDQ